MTQQSNETSGSGSARSGAGTSGGTECPDWNALTFEVPCPDCGADLNGHTSPECDSCGSVFNWDTVLPLERLTCLKCGYRLVGLHENRCPECGNPFEWETVLAAARQRGVMLFETQWYDDPIRGLLRSTSLALFSPRRLWNSYDMRFPPNVLALLALMCIQWAIFARGWQTMAWVIGPSMNAVADWTNTGLTFVYPYRPSPFFVPTVLIAYLAGFAALQLLFETKRRLQINWRQILRVYVHASYPASLVTAAWCAAEMLLDCTLFFTRAVVGTSQRPYVLLGEGLLTAALLLFWIYLTIGLRQYLKMPHTWAVSTLAILIGFLFGYALSPEFL